MRPILLTIIVCAGIFAEGCAVGPDYHAPKVSSLPSFGELNGVASTNEPVSKWWEEFHDVELARLIGEAMHSNYTMQIAVTRIRESRFQRGITSAGVFPVLDADGSFDHSRGSKNVVLPLGNASTGSQSGSSLTPASQNTPQARAVQAGSSSQGDLGANPLNTPPSPFGQGGLPGATTDLYQVGLDATWEIDVFGGQRRQIEAASAELESVSENLRNTQVSLAAEVALDYFQLRGAQERLRIAQENLTAQNDLLYLTRSRRGAGLTSEFNVARQAAETASTQATIPPLEAECREQIHALSTLLAREPNDLSSELSAVKPLPTTPPEVPVGLPSGLLERRPDIKAAEREIAAANARIGSAKADLFPKFALIGSAGLDSSSTANLFNWESRYFLISPTVSWRIFDAGRIAANIRLQRAIQVEAGLSYRNSILTALKEVEDALVKYATEQTRRNELTEQLNQDRHALELALDRYDRGLSDFLNVLDAEKSLLSAEDTLAQSSLSVDMNLVALYKSLGGGWK